MEPMWRLRPAPKAKWKRWLRIKELGRRGFALIIDLMKFEDIEPMVKEAAQLLGGIDYPGE
jgi:hypothetical protein